MKHIIQLLLLFVFTNSFASTNKTELFSPNGKIMADMQTIEKNGYYKASLKITYRDIDGDHILFENLPVGLKTNKQNLVDSLKLVAVSPPKEIIENYRMVTGKKVIAVTMQLKRSIALRIQKDKN